MLETGTASPFAMFDGQQQAWFEGKSVAMNGLREIMPMEAAIVSRATSKQQLFKICYLTVIAVAMVSWLSAFGWVTVAVAKWLLA